MSLPNGRKSLTLCTLALDAVIYPDPQGGYNPPVFTRHPPPNHLKFKGGYQGVFTGVFM